MGKLITWILVCICLYSAVPTLTQDSCDGATVLENRVGRIDYGRVTLGGSSNRVRAEPSTDADVVFLMLPGQVFFVSEFPVCTDDIMWLHVDVNGRTGWTAESIADVGYFVEPLVGLQTISDTQSYDVGAIDLTFSRDGQNLYALQPDNTVQVISVTGKATDTLMFDVDDPILQFVVDHNDSGYATIQATSVTLWNLNLDILQTIEPLQLTSIKVVEISPDWEWVGLGGCIQSTDGWCALGATELVNINTGEHLIFEENDTVTVISFLMRAGMGTIENSIEPFLVSIVTANGRGRAFDLSAGEEYFTMTSPSDNKYYAMDWDPSSLVIYGMCDGFDDTGNCKAGKISALSWFSGGGRGIFADFESAVTDVILSPASPSEHRLIGLAQGEIVIMYDYDPFEDETIRTIQKFDDILPDVMALSPDGSVLAIANDTQLMVYDISILGSQ